jgi:leucyl aminopeptidase (aminopeptidase T)
MFGSVISNRLQKTCMEHKVKYTYLVDPAPSYFGTGINADYKIVEEKTMKIGKLCTEAKEIHLTSSIGSDIKFKLYDYWVPCVPELTPKIKLWNQHPEGEAQMCPIEETFTGRVVTRGPFRYAGQGTKPIVFDYQEGKIVNVNGDKGLQERILKRIKELDPTHYSFNGTFVGEFAVGSNDWAVFDDNVSNCEKVSGTIHFALGSRDQSYMESCRKKYPKHPAGKDRGEKFHLDFMLTTPTIVVTKQNGEKIKLIEEGHLLI